MRTWLGVVGLASACLPASAGAPQTSALRGKLVGEAFPIDQVSIQRAAPSRVKSLGKTDMVDNYVLRFQTGTGPVPAQSMQVTLAVNLNQVMSGYKWNQTATTFGSDAFRQQHFRKGGCPRGIVSVLLILKKAPPGKSRVRTALDNIAGKIAFKTVTATEAKGTIEIYLKDPSRTYLKGPFVAKFQQ